MCAKNHIIALVGVCRIGSRVLRVKNAPRALRPARALPLSAVVRFGRTSSSQRRVEKRRSSKDGRSRDARLRWLLGRECSELRHDASYRFRPTRRLARGRSRVVSKRSHLRDPRLTFSGFFAAFDVGFFVALSARPALMKLHTPVPCMVSVAPTAYRAPSNAVLMDQKMGIWNGRGERSGEAAARVGCAAANDDVSIRDVETSGAHRAPSDSPTGFPPPVSRRQSVFSGKGEKKENGPVVSHVQSLTQPVLSEYARASRSRRHMYRVAAFIASPRRPRGSTARRRGCRCARTPSPTW